MHVMFTNVLKYCLLMITNTANNHGPSWVMITDNAY